jgi:SAM-dependent methyltransferase
LTQSPIASRTLREQFPDCAFRRASAYDLRFALEGSMGPNVLWLAEWVSQAVDLRPEMTVLDLGCGRAASSIFLAKEFGSTVWAADLWTSPGENRQRIAQAGLSERVFALSAEAHTLPFGDDQFDLIISLDAYHYFGTDDLYLGYISRFLKPGGRLVVVSPGVTQELSEIPPTFRPYWEWEYCSFHSPSWWRRHWEKTSLLDVEGSDLLPDGWVLWAEWFELMDRLAAQGTLNGLSAIPAADVRGQAEMVRTDAGRTLGFVRLIARNPGPS